MRTIVRLSMAFKEVIRTLPFLILAYDRIAVCAPSRGFSVATIANCFAKAADTGTPGSVVQDNLGHKS